MSFFSYLKKIIFLVFFVIIFLIVYQFFNKSAEEIFSSAFDVFDKNPDDVNQEIDALTKLSKRYENELSDLAKNQIPSL